jgi:transposase
VRRDRSRRRRWGAQVRAGTAPQLQLERIEQSPHLTLHGLKNELAARGVKVSHNGVWLFLRREGCDSKNPVRA